MLETLLLRLHIGEVAHSGWSHGGGAAGGQTSGLRLAHATHLRLGAGRLVVSEVRRGHGQLRAGSGHLGVGHVGSFTDHSAAGGLLGSVTEEDVVEGAATEAFPPGVADESAMPMEGAQQQVPETAEDTNGATLLITIFASRGVADREDPAGEHGDGADEVEEGGDDGADLLLLVITDKHREERRDRCEEHDREMVDREPEARSGHESGVGVGAALQLESCIEDLTFGRSFTCLLCRVQGLHGSGEDSEREGGSPDDGASDTDRDHACAEVHASAELFDFEGEGLHLGNVFCTFF